MHRRYVNDCVDLKDDEAVCLVGINFLMTSDFPSDAIAFIHKFSTINIFKSDVGITLIQRRTVGQTL